MISSRAIISLFYSLVVVVSYFLLTDRGLDAKSNNFVERLSDCNTKHAGIDATLKLSAA